MNRKHVFFIVVTGCLLMLHTTTYAGQQGREISPVLQLLLSGKLTGVFIDSRVKGLRYTTSSGISGRTGAGGEFKYRKGDTIEFFIGSNSLGSVPAEQLISVIQLNDFSKLAMLLQALDTDHRPENGIQLDVADDEALAKALVPLQEVDPEDEDFTTNFKRITGRDFQINKYNSVEHSYRDIRLEALKKTASTNLLYRYYIGDITINDAFNKQKLEKSSRARVQLYYWQYLVRPYIELSGQKIWNDTESTLEHHELFETSVEKTAMVASAVNIVVAHPTDVLEGFKDGFKEATLDASVDFVTSDALPANGVVGSAVKEFFNRELKLVLKCSQAYITEKNDDILKCSIEASKQIVGIVNDIKTSVTLSQNNADLNAYTVVTRMLNEWYWGGGDVGYIAGRFGMPKYSNAAFLAKIKEMALWDDAPCNDTLASNLFKDSLDKISAATKKFFEATGLPADLSNPGDLINFSFLDPKLVEGKLEFCYKVENRANAIVDISPTFKVTPTVLATTPASIEQTEELSLGPLGGFSHCATLTVDNYQQGQELEDFINLSLKVQYSIFTDLDNIEQTETKTSIYHFNQNFLELVKNAALLSVNVTTPIAASPGENCPLSIRHNFPVTGPVQYDWKQVLQNQSWRTVSIAEPHSRQTSFVVPDLPTGVTQKSLWFAVTVTSVDSGEHVDKVIRVVVQPDASAPLLPPANLSASGGNDSILFSWDAVPEAESYTLYVASQSGITPENYDTFPYYAKVSGITTDHYDFTGLTDGTTYYAIVTAERNFSESGPSNEISCGPDTCYASQGEWATVFQDDMNDDVLDPSIYRINNANGSVESNGYIQTNQNETDVNKSLGTQYFNSKSKVKITSRQYTHRNGNYYRAALSLVRKSDEKYIGYIIHYYYDWSDPEAGVPSHDVRIYTRNINDTGFSYKSIVPFKQDTWMNQEIEFDFNAGTMKGTIDGVSEIVQSDYLKQFKNTEVYIAFSPYGWWTGHYIRTDDLHVETK